MNITFLYSPPLVDEVYECKEGARSRLFLGYPLFKEAVFARGGAGGVCTGGRD